MERSRRPFRPAQSESNLPAGECAPPWAVTWAPAGRAPSGGPLQRCSSSELLFRPRSQPGSLRSPVLSLPKSLPWETGPAAPGSRDKGGQGSEVRKRYWLDAGGAVGMGRALAGGRHRPPRTGPQGPGRGPAVPSCSSRNPRGALSSRGVAPCSGASCQSGWKSHGHLGMHDSSPGVMLSGVTLQSCKDQLLEFAVGLLPGREVGAKGADSLLHGFSSPGYITPEELHPPVTHTFSLSLSLLEHFASAASLRRSILGAVFV